MDTDCLFGKFFLWQREPKLGVKSTNVFSNQVELYFEQNFDKNRNHSSSIVNTTISMLFLSKLFEVESHLEEEVWPDEAKFIMFGQFLNALGIFEAMTFFQKLNALLGRFSFWFLWTPITPQKSMQVLIFESFLFSCKVFEQLLKAVRASMAESPKTR